ncbi:hypothetical protein Ahy_A01g001374 isoform F [Arachis hypogaea]|uniref:Uncharacterized protein n=1 Tax=Arachis hypogaea TaxID=3818 RepID=A0A445EN03_ARAHY|nr:hypothetical protein Ahy_A01g001374 isoform F [Arachis hypogaea]
MKASGTEIPNNKKTRSNIVPNGMALEDPWNQTRAFSKKNTANAVAGNIKAVLRRRTEVYPATGPISIQWNSINLINLLPFEGDRIPRAAKTTVTRTVPNN